MLNNVTLVPALPALVLERAQRFYEEILGLTLVRKDAGLLVFGAGDSLLHVYKSDVPASSNTSVCLLIDDFDAALQEMRGRGVNFEAYELPSLDSDDGESQSKGPRTAWFRDSEGNILKIEERGGRYESAPRESRS